MAAFRFLSKDERLDPGVNLDSCGEDSDPDTPNNEKLQCFSSGGGGPLTHGEAVHNDLSECHCSGSKCICDAPVTECSWGGPDADPSPKVCDGHKRCSTGRDRDRPACLGATKLSAPKKKTYQCTPATPYQLCSVCFALPYCAVHGTQCERLRKLK